LDIFSRSAARPLERRTPYTIEVLTGHRRNGKPKVAINATGASPSGFAFDSYADLAAFISALRNAAEFLLDEEGFAK
jgi:hypothetical protein